MKTLILTAIRCSLVFIVPTVTYATSAQWDLDPISGAWNTDANWTPTEVPNGPADVATFGLSNTTDVSISANTEVNGITFTAAATNPYTVTASSGLTLTISGVGIVNNSGIAPNFVTVAGGEIRFTNKATGGSNVSISNDGGTTNFFDHATATGIIGNESGSVQFVNRSTAGSATIFGQSGDGGSVSFSDSSSAGSARINFSGGILYHITFDGHSTADSATLSSGEEGSVEFFDHSSAGNATIVAFLNPFGGVGVEFSGSSTADRATIEGRASGIFFSGLSKGGTAAIRLFEGFLEDLGSSLSYKRS